MLKMPRHFPKLINVHPLGLEGGFSLQTLFI